MHNLHLIRVSANSAKEACEKVENHFNKKQELDFSKLKVNPNHFLDLFQPYDKSSYPSFQEYLEDLIDPGNQMVLWEIDDGLRSLGFHETASLIDKFLEEAGYEPDTLDNLFSFQVIGGLDKSNIFHGQLESRWDTGGFSIENFNRTLSEAYGRDIDCFETTDANEFEGEWDSYGITDWSSSSNQEKFIVITDVKS